jgi:hypothetical protein
VGNGLMVNPSARANSELVRCYSACSHYSTSHCWLGHLNVCLRVEWMKCLCLCGKGLTKSEPTFSKHNSRAQHSIYKARY